jgi:predicted transcriptional regulator
MKVSDLIGSRREVYSIPEETSVHLGAQYLREKQVRSVGVLDSRGRLIGVVSQSDISDKVAAENKCPAWMKVSDIMSRILISVNLEMTLEDCLALMDQHGVYHLLVLDGRNDFRGMVSVSDLLRVLSTDHKERADLLQAFIDPLR